MNPRVLLFWGGWDGHQPEKIAQLLACELSRHGLEPQVESSLDCLNDPERLKTYQLIIPCWTMGQLSDAQGKALQEAVKSGVALGGIHGGMGDAFRGNLDYEWMCGGHFVGHPHVGDYTVRLKDFATPITQGLPGSFAYRSEQYYVMTDPAIQVLADTEYLHEGRFVTVPVAWVKTWGKGRVFYCSLGHAPEEFTQFPEALTLTVRGLLWAANAL
ncbi:MAG: ThuA domain-containing protein [Chthoniobacteraceae bacterium]|nr:ThuA domain-containing protein [Chthoniobacteraceae bacterium]